MSILVPFLILLLSGLVAAYHRLPLLVWVLLTLASLAAAGWAGASTTATAVAMALLALGAYTPLTDRQR